METTTPRVLLEVDKGIPPIARTLGRTIEEETANTFDTRRYQMDITGTAKTAIGDFSDYVQEVPNCPFFNRIVVYAQNLQSPIYLALSFLPPLYVDTSSGAGSFYATGGIHTVAGTPANPAMQTVQVLDGLPRKRHTIYIFPCVLGRGGLPSGQSLTRYIEFSLVNTKL